MDEQKTFQLTVSKQHTWPQEDIHHNSTTKKEDISTPSSSSPLPNKSPGITTTRSGRSVRRPPHIVKDYIAGIQESYNNAGGELRGDQSAGAREKLM